MTAGVETRFCNHNSAHTETRPVAINPTAHTWGNWTVTTPATSTTAGVETRVCIYNPAHTETRSVWTVTVIDSYVSNDGAGSYTPGATVTIRVGTNTGYTFNGWTTSTTGVGIANAQNATTTFVMPNSNVTITAHWIAQPGGTSPGGSLGGGGAPGTGGSGTTSEDEDEIEIDDETTPLAVWGSLISFENTGGIVAYDDAEGVTNYVRFSFVVGSRIYFFNYVFTEYYLVPNFKTFTDIDGHWARDEILWSASREIINGYNDGSFKPDEVLTRAMFATLLTNLAADDLSACTERVFSDVDPDSWFGPSIAWAYENGIVTGRGDGTFDPHGNITRQDMTLMIVRFLSYMGISLVDNEINGSFADSNQVAEWAVNAVAQMRNYGIIQGKPGNLFDPWGNATRAEAVVIINRIVESAIMRAINEMNEILMVAEQPTA